MSQANETLPVVVQLLDNLYLWAFVALALAALFNVWGTIHVLNLQTGPILPYNPTGVPGR